MQVGGNKSAWASEVHSQRPPHSDNAHHRRQYVIMRRQKSSSDVVGERRALLTSLRVFTKTISKSLSSSDDFVTTDNFSRASFNDGSLTGSEGEMCGSEVMGEESKELS